MADAAPALALRKRQELAAKLAGLAVELSRWGEQARDASYEKHRSQIERLTAQIGGLRDALALRLGDSGGREGLPLAAAPEFELDLLALHRVWEHYRGKLALRQVPWLRPYLEAADELAWASYKPACDQAIAARHVTVEEVREPPLVFLNGGSSPFARPRSFAYQAEAVPGEDLRAEAVRALLSRLPVPLIGVPWSQVAHLPDLVVVGHEAGHLVAEDLRLKSPLRRALVAALAEEAKPRKVYWLRWLDEVFADLWGVLATGPAYAGALMDFLVASPAEVAGERQETAGDGVYPTVALRVRLLWTALARLGFASEGARRREEWTAVYGAAHAMPELEPDLEPVVVALLETPLRELGGKALREILSFTAADHQRALSDAGRILNYRNPEASDIRRLAAASRLAFETSPLRYRQPAEDAPLVPDAQRRILDRFQQMRAVGPRTSLPRQDPGSQARQDRHDLQAGPRLLEILHGRSAGDEESEGSEPAPPTD